MADTTSIIRGATTMTNKGDGTASLRKNPDPPQAPARAEHKVTHHYHDHANDPDGDYDDQQIVHKTERPPGGEQSFPMKLHYMLNDIEQDNLSHIVSWMPHGRCFVVHNQKLFVEKILGCWFRQSKIASFQRQLNIYGFQRLTTGPDKTGYYHELFLRSKPGLAANIQRQKLKGTKTRRAASPESEPNFYAMTPMPPSNSSSPLKAVARAGLRNTLMDQKTGGRVSATPLTLQKIVPALFSPAAFETTVHLVPAPQCQSRQQRLMVSSTCSLTLKPYSLGGNGGFSSTQFPMTTTSLTFQGGSRQVPALGPLTSCNEALWAALGRSAMPTPLTMQPPTNGDATGAKATTNSTPAPLWLSR